MTSGDEIRNLANDQAEVAGKVSFSHNGKILAATSFGEGRNIIIKLWDVASGKELHTIIETGGDTNVAFSPDDKILASIFSDFTNETFGVNLWGVVNGRKLRTLNSSSEVNDVAFLPDNTTLAMVSFKDVDYSATIKLWDITRGVELHTWAGQDFASSFAFSPDGKLLISIDPVND